MTGRQHLINIPVVPFKAPGETDAQHYRHVAECLDRGYELNAGSGGNALKAAVAQILRSVATALDASDRVKASTPADPADDDDDYPVRSVTI